jgi:hypothetical protein
MSVHADMTQAKDHVRTMSALDDSAVSIKARISLLWVSATLCYLYGDVIGFYSPGGLQRILDGKLGDWTVTPTWLLGVAVLMSMPAVMVALTVLLMRFKANAGVAPLTYLQNLRMRLAEQRLREGEMSISELAESLGYESDSAFSNAFKRRTGMAPKHYRSVVARMDQPTSHPADPNPHHGS